MSNDKKPEAQASKKNPFTISANQRAVLLVPFEDKARDRVADLLAAQYPDLELPKTVTQLKLNKLTDRDVLFTAVAKVTKLGQRKQPSDYALVVGQPVVVGKYMPEGLEDIDPDYGAIVDALTTGIHPACRVVVSEDLIAKML